MSFMLLFLQAVLKGCWKTNNAPLRNSEAHRKKIKYCLNLYSFYFMKFIS